MRAHAKALAYLAVSVVGSALLAGCTTPSITCQASSSTKQYSAVTAKDFSRDWRKLNAIHRTLGHALVEGDLKNMPLLSAETAVSLQRISQYSSTVPSETCEKFAASARRLDSVQSKVVEAGAARDRDSMLRINAEIHSELDTIRALLPRWWFSRPQLLNARQSKRKSF